MKNRELHITPDELYCLADMLQAEYLDYAYVAALNGDNRKLELLLKESRASLIKKDILQEDFGGNITLPDDYSELFMPLFTEGVESSVDILDVSEKRGLQTYKFHLLDNAITMVTTELTGFCIRPVSENVIWDLVSGLIPEERTYKSENPISEIQKDSICMIITVKSIEAEARARNSIFVITEEALCENSINNRWISLNREKFIAAVYERILEVREWHSEMKTEG